MKSHKRDIESRAKAGLFNSVALLAAVLLLAFAGIVGCEKKQAEKSQSDEESPAVEGEPSEDPAETAPDEAVPKDPGKPAGAEPKDEPKTPGTLDDRLIPTDEMKPADAPTDPMMQAEETPEDGTDEESGEEDPEDLAQNEGEDEDSALAE